MVSNATVWYICTATFKQCRVYHQTHPSDMVGYRKLIRFRVYAASRNNSQKATWRRERATKAERDGPGEGGRFRD